MSLKYEYPKTLGVKEMFAWWCKQKIRKKRYLKLVNERSNSSPTQLIANNGDELNWLREHVLILAKQIEKLEIEDKGNMHFTKKTEAIYAKKKELYHANKRIDHLEQVDHKTTHVVIQEKMFRDVIERFNLAVRDRIVNNGEVVNMKQKLGYVYVQKIDRFKTGPTSKSTKMPNWGESYKYRDELIAKGIQIMDKDHPDGKKWMIYYDDDWYLRFAWAKSSGACRVKNHIFYSFKPANSIGGPKKQLTQANRKNPLLHLTYHDKRIYYPQLDPNFKKT